jgi:hypothetical protein
MYKLCWCWYFGLQHCVDFNPEGGENLFFKILVPPASLHDFTTQNTNINIFTAVRTWNLIYKMRIKFHSKVVKQSW